MNTAYTVVLKNFTLMLEKIKNNFFQFSGQTNIKESIYMFFQLVNNIHLVLNKIGLNLVKNLSRSTDNSVLARLLVWSTMIIWLLFPTRYTVLKNLYFTMQSDN